MDPHYDLRMKLRCKIEKEHAEELKQLRRSLDCEHLQLNDVNNNLINDVTNNVSTKERDENTSNRADIKEDESDLDEALGKLSLS